MSQCCSWSVMKYLCGKICKAWIFFILYKKRLFNIIWLLYCNCCTISLPFKSLFKPRASIVMRGITRFHNTDHWLHRLTIYILVLSLWGLNPSAIAIRMHLLKVNGGVHRKVPYMLLSSNHILNIKHLYSVWKALYSTLFILTTGLHLFHIHFSVWGLNSWASPLECTYWRLMVEYIGRNHIHCGHKA